MTRREAREHCFKMLFCQDFYPAEEKEEQLERYFDAPVEDVTGKDGADEVLHQVDLEGADKTAPGGPGGGYREKKDPGAG